jgi:hypothetical protein
MATYKTSLDINAPAGRVWQILTSFDRYREWNPQIPTAAGKAEKGTHITLLAPKGSHTGGGYSNHQRSWSKARISRRDHLDSPRILAFLQFHVMLRLAGQPEDSVSVPKAGHRGGATVDGVTSPLWLQFLESGAQRHQNCRIPKFLCTR